MAIHPVSISIKHVRRDGLTVGSGEVQEVDPEIIN
jgi:hypothetical protein